jgi:hypothetical protein
MSTSSAPTGGPSSGERAASGPSGDAHALFTVQGLKIGMPLDGDAGFTCTKEDRDVQGRKDRHCVKFVDSRCAGKPGAVGQKQYRDTAPLGCFLDYSSNATYLDGTLMQEINTGDREQMEAARRRGRKPLHNIHIVGTKSQPAKIYSIRFTFAVDELTEGSKLYAALVAKYGEPSRKNPPLEMRWSRDGTEMKAYCTEHQQCEIMVEDANFERIENQKQEELDGQERRRNAPDAPTL